MTSAVTSAPSGAKHHRRVTRRELYDVHDLSAENPVARAGVAAHHFETLAFVILFGLLGRKPLMQKILTSPSRTLAQPGCE